MDCTTDQQIRRSPQALFQGATRSGALMRQAGAVGADERQQPPAASCDHPSTLAGGARSSQHSSRRRAGSGARSLRSQRDGGRLFQGSAAQGAAACCGQRRAAAAGAGRRARQPKGPRGGLPAASSCRPHGWRSHGEAGRGEGGGDRLPEPRLLSQRPGRHADTRDHVAARDRAPGRSAKTPAPPTAIRHLPCRLRSARTPPRTLRAPCSRCSSASAAACRRSWRTLTGALLLWHRWCAVAVCLWRPLPPIAGAASPAGPLHHARLRLHT